MKTKFIKLYKTDQKWIQEGMDFYTKRLGKYLQIEQIELEINNKTTERGRVLLLEAEKVLSNIKNTDTLILLDEVGQSLTSVAFAEFLNKRFVTTSGDLVFVIGGAYGFHESIKQRANFLLSLSPMTFTHQMVRVIFLEQLYRALTILKNEPYHHE